MKTDRFYIGPTEALEAEYGVQCDEPFCLVTMYDNEINAVEGFGSIEAAKTALFSDGSVDRSQVEWMI